MSRLSAAPCILAAALALATPVAGQERTPAQTQALVELARVLGESHALRQACRGRDDSYWFNRMKQLTAIEAPDQAMLARLTLSFNGGWNAGKIPFPACNSAARAQTARDARAGRTLAAGLEGQ